MKPRSSAVFVVSPGVQQVDFPSQPILGTFRCSPTHRFRSSWLGNASLWPMLQPASPCTASSNRCGWNSWRMQHTPNTRRWTSVLRDWKIPTNVAHPVYTCLYHIYPIVPPKFHLVSKTHSSSKHPSSNSDDIRMKKPLYFFTWYIWYHLFISGY